MRSVGFAVLGALVGGAVALGLGVMRSESSTLVDPQGLHLIGVIFVAIPVGVVLGAGAGVVLALLTRR